MTNLNYEYLKKMYQLSGIQEVELQLQDSIAKDGVAVLCAYSKVSLYELNRIIELIDLDSDYRYLEVELLSPVLSNYTGEVILRHGHTLLLSELNNVVEMAYYAGVLFNHMDSSCI